mmetsp:Transcript_9601/g.23255  ORF Transcript_9601/g.23255 Transcript_9601/m.23255 type:complete len:300 (+) Transcript_9601:2176-3075(+)
MGNVIRGTEEKGNTVVILLFRHAHLLGVHLGPHQVMHQDGGVEGERTIAVQVDVHGHARLPKSYPARRKLTTLVKIVADQATNLDRRHPQGAGETKIAVELVEDEAGAETKNHRGHLQRSLLPWRRRRIAAIEGLQAGRSAHHLREREGRRVLIAEVEAEAHHLQRLFRQGKTIVTANEVLLADHLRFLEVGVDHHQGVIEERTPKIAPETPNEGEADHQVDQHLLRLRVVEVMTAVKVVATAPLLDARVAMLGVAIRTTVAAADPGHHHTRIVPMKEITEIAIFAVTAGHRCDRRADG